MNALLRLLGRLERWAKGEPPEPPEPAYEAHKRGAEMMDSITQHVPPADYERPLPSDERPRVVKKPAKKRRKV